MEQSLDKPNYYNKETIKTMKEHIEENVAETLVEGEAYAKLTKNKSNRQWFNRKKADAEISEKGFVELCYKPTRHVGSIGSKLPNEKLISYLSEDLQAEYKAIVERAIAAREAAKTKPMTELEKAQAKLAKAQAALAKLEAEAAEGNI